MQGQGLMSSTKLVEH